MASERVQRQIDHLLDEAEAAINEGSWTLARQHAQSVLAIDPDNTDALTYIAAAERALGDSAPSPDPPPQPTLPPSSDQPTSFANGRYEVKRFLGEGGKKRVYLAQDTTLDREVAFALLKTEGLAQRREPGHIFISHVEDQESHLRRPHVQGIQFYFVPGLIVRVIPIQSNPRLLGVCNGI